MKNKMWLNVALLCFAVSSGYASSYPGEPLPSQKHHAPVGAYDCHWASNVYVQYYIHQLQRYNIQTVVYPYQLRIVVPDYVFFAPLTDVVIQSAQDPFYIIVGLLEKLPYSKIKVIGYSDNIATQEINQDMSMRQAEKLSGYLWTRNIPNETQSSTFLGKGEEEPIANNDRVNGMAQNRRVEIWVSIPRKQYAPYLG